MAFQISMVAGILAYKFGATFAWITTFSMAAYIAFTLTVTQVLLLSLNKRSSSELSGIFELVQFT